VSIGAVPKNQRMCQGNPDNNPWQRPGGSDGQRLQASFGQCESSALPPYHGVMVRLCCHSMPIWHRCSPAPRRARAQRRAPSGYPPAKTRCCSGRGTHGTGGRVRTGLFGLLVRVSTGVIHPPTAASLMARLDTHAWRLGARGIDRVSWPSSASLHPMAWRSIWWGIGKPNWAASRVRATLCRKVASVLGPFRAVTNTYGVAGSWRANWRNARSSSPWRE
jgi:hypothetical protein